MIRPYKTITNRVDGVSAGAPECPRSRGPHPVGPVPRPGLPSIAGGSRQVKIDANMGKTMGRKREEVAAGTFDAGARGWIVRTAHSNYHRVAGWYELEDLIQDGALIFMKCRKRYIEEHPGSVENQRHFMGKFQRAFSNHITDLAWKRTRQNEVPMPEVVSEEDGGIIEVDIITEPEAATLAVMLRQAPVQIKRVLELFATEVGLKRLRKHRKHTLESSRKETMNDRLCFMTGLDPDIYDLSGAIKSYLSPNKELATVFDAWADPEI